MKHLPLLLLPFLAACVPTAPPGQPEVLVPGDANAPSQVTPSEALAIAETFTNHPWRPFASNILHGKDKAGILVRTPDVGYQPDQPRRGWWTPGQVNHGIPYKWGGLTKHAFCFFL